MSLNVCLIQSRSPEKMIVANQSLESLGKLDSTLFPI